jgi:cell division protein FtsL
MAILILVLICIQLSVSISGLQKQVQSLSEDLALHKIDQEVPEETNRNSILLP